MIPIYLLVWRDKFIATKHLPYPWNTLIICDSIKGWRISEIGQPILLRIKFQITFEKETLQMNMLDLKIQNLILSIFQFLQTKKKVE